MPARQREGCFSKKPLIKGIKIQALGVFLQIHPSQESEFPGVGWGVGVRGGRCVCVFPPVKPYPGLLLQDQLSPSSNSWEIKANGLRDFSQSILGYLKHRLVRDSDILFGS